MPEYLITVEIRYLVKARAKHIAEAAAIGTANGMHPQTLGRELECQIKPRGSDIVCITEESGYQR